MGANFILPCLPFFLIDGIEFACRMYLPQTGRYACSMLPFLKISALIIPHQLVSFANNQCVTIPIEPTLSIIFFMFKTSLVLVIGLILPTWTFVLPTFLMSPQLRKRRSECLKRIDDNITQNHGIIGSITKHGWALVVVGLTTFWFFLILDKTPGHFGIGALSKIMEYVAVISLFCATLLFAGNVVSIVFYVITRILRIR